MLFVFSILFFLISADFSVFSILEIFIFCGDSSNIVPLKGTTLSVVVPF